MPEVAVLDIETTGLDKEKCEITVVVIVIYDTVKRNIRNSHCYNICLEREKGEGPYEQTKREISAILNEAEKLVAHNGRSFDLPWLAHWIFPNQEDIISTWNAKTIDFCYEGKQRMDSYIGMQQVCDTNNILISKIATGKQAILWAQEREWALLEEYCTADVMVLLEILKKAMDGEGIVLKPKQAKFPKYKQKKCYLVLKILSDMSVEAQLFNHEEDRQETKLLASAPLHLTEAELQNIFG